MGREGDQGDGYKEKRVQTKEEWLVNSYVDFYQTEQASSKDNGKRSFQLVRKKSLVFQTGYHHVHSPHKIFSSKELRLRKIQYQLTDFGCNSQVQAYLVCLRLYLGQSVGGRHKSGLQSLSKTHLLLGSNVYKTLFLLEHIYHL